MVGSQLKINNLWQLVTLLQDVAIVHWDCCGMCGSTVQDQACRPPIGEAEILRVKEMSHGMTSKTRSVSSRGSSWDKR